MRRHCCDESRGMKWRRLLLGMVVGNLAGVLLCLHASWLSRISGNSGALIVYPNLVAIPFAIGLVAAWVWKPLNLTIGRCVLHSLSCVFLGLGGAWLVFREGVICLVIIFPILYAFLLGGVLVGRVWFRSDRGNLNLTLFPLLALVAISEPLVRHDQRAVVTDELLVHASPQQIWPHLTSFPEIKAPPRFWLFRLGLPKPMSTTAAGDFVGADRRCNFSGGAVFRERVVELAPNERLTFDIVESPPDPELIGHLTPHRGEFELRDNHDGTTTLIGRTWYSLHVRPLWYFDWWTRHIFRAVHLRVMQNVRKRSELRS